MVTSVCGKRREWAVIWGAENQECLVGAGKELKEGRRIRNLGENRSIYARVFALDANKHLDSPVEHGLDLFGEGAESLAGRRDRCGDSERSKNIYLCWDCSRAAVEHYCQGRLRNLSNLTLGPCMTPYRQEL